MYLWHEPHLCNAATTSAPVHYLQVISLLALGALFWWPIVGPSSRTAHFPHGRNGLSD